MKNFNLMSLAVALAISSYGLAQRNASTYQNSQNDPKTVEWPAAYLNGTATPNADNASGIQNETVLINLNHVEKAYFGSYGNARPNGTSGLDESLIYTNGPIVDGEAGSNLSIVQNTSLGMSSYGYGVQKSIGNSIADEFVLTEDFDISKMEFYLYQSGETSATITEAYIRIWDGDPSGAGSIVWGDLSTNLLDNVVLTDIYRVLENDQSSQNRRIQLVTATTSGLTLAAGNYYVETSFSGTGSSGPWMPPITVGGESYTGDALQYITTTNNWTPVVDDGNGDPQGIPFMIYGTLSASDTCGEINPHYDWYFEKGYTITGGFTVANDITIDANKNFELQSISVAVGSEWPINDLNVVYYEDNNGEPGDEIGSENSPNIVSSTAIGSIIGTIYNVYSLEIEVDPFQFTGQETNNSTYWIGIKDADNDHDYSIFWVVTSGNKEGYLMKQTTTDVWDDYEPFDGVYTFKGECSDILAIDDNHSVSLQVYPNPATDVIHLNANKPIGAVSLYNMLGQEVLHTKNESNTAEINISHLPVGTYILKNESVSQSQSFKIIKK